MSKVSKMVELIGIISWIFMHTIGYQFVSKLIGNEYDYHLYSMILFLILLIIPTFEMSKNN